MRAELQQQVSSNSSSSNSSSFVAKAALQELDSLSAFEVYGLCNRLGGSLAAAAAAAAAAGGPAVAAAAALQLNQQQLLRAVRRTKPSVSPQQTAFYEGYAETVGAVGPHSVGDSP